VKTPVRVENVTRGTVLAGRVGVARRWWQRFRGLLGRPPLGCDEGLLLTPCRAVHTYGMRTPLDVVFLDGEARVVALYPALPPRRRTAWHGAATRVIELAPGAITRSATRLGDLVRIDAARAGAGGAAR